VARIVPQGIDAGARAAEHARTPQLKQEQAMDPFTTPGAFSWCELATSDPAKATAFYSSLFGWTFDTMDVGTGPYHVAKLGGAAIGGVSGFASGAPPVPMWGAYVTVADCDKTVAQCKSLGGTLCAGPFDVPTVGRMAVLQDPQGAVISVMAYAMPA
jgi:predicted enzyme related to lactoylglutathione lyase